MPCRDYYDDHPGAYYESEVRGLQKQVSFAESALCQVLAALERAVLVGIDPLDMIDYKEAGITRAELEKWWTNHKALDAKHRAEEAAKKKEAAEKRAKSKKKKELLSKMSAEDKEILGLK
jgi:hypothetical protein